MRSPRSLYPKRGFITGLSSLSLLGKCLQTTADRTSWESGFWAKWKEGWKTRASKPSLRQSSDKFYSLYSFILPPSPSHPLCGLFTEPECQQLCWWKAFATLPPHLPSSQKSDCSAWLALPALGPCSCFLMNTGSVFPQSGRDAGFSDRCYGRERVFPERAQFSWVKGPIVSFRQGLSLCQRLQPEPSSQWRGCLEGKDPACSSGVWRGHLAGGRRSSDTSVLSAGLSVGPWSSVWPCPCLRGDRSSFEWDRCVSKWRLCDSSNVRVQKCKKGSGSTGKGITDCLGEWHGSRGLMGTKQILITSRPVVLGKPFFSFTKN